MNLAAMVHITYIYYLAGTHLRWTFYFSGIGFLFNIHIACMLLITHTQYAQIRKPG